ncbi:MAG: hypothetical protein P1R74_15700 [Sedimenticola sp.]|nr:hypothetical protein [Sedimenticola sp.]
MDDTKYGLDDEMPFGKMAGETIEDVIDEDPEHVAGMVDAGALKLTSNAMEYLRLCLE